MKECLLYVHTLLPLCRYTGPWLVTTSNPGQSEVAGTSALSTLGLWYVGVCLSVGLLAQCGLNQLSLARPGSSFCQLGVGGRKQSS